MNGKSHTRKPPRVSRHPSAAVSARQTSQRGHRLLVATKNTPKDQALYHGFTKPREAHHDADLYRLYQRGLEKIAREGGTNIRVILDSELKKNLYRDLARSGNKCNSGDDKTEVAERHGLRVVRGKIPVPDLRIETKPRIRNTLVLTLNSQQNTTASEASPRRFAQASPLTSGS